MNNSTDTTIGEDARPGMLLVPIATEAVLPHVVRATEAAGYAGLMVVLARTAEARELHDELTGHWTSLHSVTGSLVAVLCPDPEVLDGPGGTSDKILCCHGMRLRHPGSGFQQRFGEHFDGTIYESAPSEYHEDWTPFGFRAISQIPQMARLHRDAWTEASSRCAEYFGIGEEHLPSVLLLSLWEREAVLFTAGFGSTLFGLCKALAVDLGDAPRRIDRLKTREERLTRMLGELTDARSGRAGGVPRPERPDAVSPERIMGVHDELARTGDSRPELAEACRRALRDWARTGQVGDSLLLLTELYERLGDLPWTRGQPDRNTLYSFLRDATWQVANGDGYRERVRHTKATLAEVSRRLGALRADLHLARAAEAAGCRTLGGVPAPLPGRAALTGWRLRLVADAGQPPLSLRPKRA